MQTGEGVTFRLTSQGECGGPADGLVWDLGMNRQREMPKSRSVGVVRLSWEGQRSGDYRSRSQAWLFTHKWLVRGVNREGAWY